MKILVTGAGGFIGSHIAIKLVKEGHQVVGLDNNFTATHQLIKGVKMVQGDVCKPADIRKAGKDCQIIVHCAGLLGTNEIAELGQTQLANEVNINGTVNVLDYCKETDAKHIFATKPNPRDWMNPYTITKQAAEDYCLMYAREYGVQTVALSLFWVYGKEQRQEPVNKFIPTFMKYALTDKPIPIWNDGRQIIDCCYVDDVVEAFYKTALNLSAGMWNSAWSPVYCLAESYLRIDIGTGIPITVNEVAAKVLELTGSKGGIKRIGKRLGEPLGSAIVANTAKAKHFLEYVPQTTLEEGLKKCIKWFKEKYGHKAGKKT